jgi:hypothetical protein
MILIDRRRTRPRAIAADLAPFLEMAIDARQVVTQRLQVCLTHQTCVRRITLVAPRATLKNRAKALLVLFLLGNSPMCRVMRRFPGISLRAPITNVTNLSNAKS